MLTHRGSQEAAVLTSLWQEAAFVDALTGFFHFVDTDRDGNCLFRATILVTALRPLCIASAQT